MAEEREWAPGCYEGHQCYQLTANNQVFPKGLEIAVQKEKVPIIQDWNLVRISLEVEMCNFQFLQLAQTVGSTQGALDRSHVSSDMNKNTLKTVWSF